MAQENTRYSEEELKQKLSQSYPLECMAGHKTPVSVKLVGTIRQGTKIRRIYEDEDGDCWNKTQYIDKATGEILSEEEHLFGRRISKRCAWDCT